jgi:hypothetical protein
MSGGSLTFCGHFRICRPKICIHFPSGSSELYDIEPLETEDRGPKVKPTWTVLDSPHDYYVKTPDLWAYSKSDLEQQISVRLRFVNSGNAILTRTLPFTAAAEALMGEYRHLFQAVYVNVARES